MTTPEIPAKSPRDGHALEPLLDVVEVARALHVGTSTIRKMAGRGEIKSVRIGDRILFRGEDVRAFIADRAAA